jgi:hypothetical protein
MSRENNVTDKFYVKGTRACKTPGLPRSAVGKDMDGFYTYPAGGHYLSQSDAELIMGQLQTRFPQATFFVQMVPVNFDGVSVPGL